MATGSLDFEHTPHTDRTIYKRETMPASTKIIDTLFLKQSLIKKSNKITTTNIVKCFTSIYRKKKRFYLFIEENCCKIVSRADISNCLLNLSI